MRALLFFVVTLSLALTGCADEGNFNAETEFGKRLVADLQAGNFDAIEAQLDPTAVGEGARATLARMAKLLPADAPTSIEVARLDHRTVSRTGKGTVRYVSLALQYRFGDRWFLVRAWWRRPEAGSPRVEGINVGPLRASLQEIYRFELAGKSAVHYAVLGLAVVLPLFTLLVLWSCLRAPIPRWRRALWAAVVVLGVTTLSLNWTTGTVLWQPLRFQLASAGFAKTELGPAILSISFPLGAIVFLFWRRRYKRRRPARSPVAAKRVRRAAG